MTTIEKTTIIIVSDLHLAAGSDPASGRRDPMEPFAQDLAFARWLDLLRERAANSDHSHNLLLLGDLFDFPRVQVSSAVEEPRIAKLNRIAAGHPAVFVALGRWLGAGNPITIVPGNHDFELMRPDVHRHLGGLFAQAAGLTQPNLNLSVSPWIYHVPGLLYAEHGQQYHDLNSFPALVWLKTQPPAIRNMPLGAALDTFVQCVTAKLGPEVDAPNSLASLLGNVLRTGPRGVARVAPDIARLTVVIARDLTTRGLPRHRARRKLYRACVLPQQARETEIPAEVLAQIDRLAESTANRLLVRVAGVSWRRFRFSHESHETRPPSDYLVRAASKIRRVLDRGDAGTVFYVFGHSHRAEQRALGDHPSGAVYLN